MELHVYKALRTKDQFDILLEVGVLLLDRTDKVCSYLLNQIDGFYVEVGHRLNINEISGLRSFNTTDLLKPYLESIETGL